MPRDLFKELSNLVKILHLGCPAFQYVQLLIILFVCFAAQPTTNATSTLCYLGPNNCSCNTTAEDLYKVSCVNLNFWEFPSISEPLAVKIIYLDLSNNYITNLHPESLSNFSSLQTLHLSSNAIQQLPESVFANLHSIYEINLQFNSLSNLPYGIFHNLGTLSKITLSGSKWICNSRLTWLRDWLVEQRKNNVSIDYDDIICAEPDSLKNLKLLDVDFEFVENLMSCVAVDGQPHLVLYYAWHEYKEYNTELCAEFCFDEKYTYTAIYETHTCICGQTDDGRSTAECADACTNVNSVCNMTVVEGAFYLYDIYLSVDKYGNIFDTVDINAITYIKTSAVFNWETGDGQVFSGPSSILYKYGAPGNYTIKAILNVSGKNQTGTAEIEVLHPVDGYLSCPSDPSSSSFPQVNLTVTGGSQIIAKWMLPDHSIIETVENIPSHVLGIDAFGYYPHLSTLDPVSISAHASSTPMLVLFPTQYFKENAVLSSWEFISVESAPEIHVHLQVFRPTCGANQVPIPPGCCESCSSFFTCEDEDVDDSASSSSEKSYTHSNEPLYKLISETAIISTSTQATLNQVLPHTEIKVQKYDIIGFQQDSEFIKCSSVADTSTDSFYHTFTTSWLSLGDDVPIPLENKTSGTCLFRVLYTKPGVVNPPIIKTLAAGLYSYQVELSSPISQTSLNCTVSLEDTIQDLQIVNPSTDTLSSGMVPLIAVVTTGSLLSSNWTIHSTTDNITYFDQVDFSRQCPDELANEFSICNELMQNSDMSVAVINFVFQPCSTYTLSVVAFNEIEQKVVNQTVVVVEDSVNLMLSSQPELNEIYKDSEVIFFVNFSSSCSFDLQWLVDGNLQDQDNNRQLRYTFHTEGTHTITLFMAGISETINVTVKNTWQLLFTSAAKFVLIGQQTNFSLSLKGIVGTPVTVTWDFGDNTMLKVATFTLKSEDSDLIESHSFHTKDVFTINVTVQYNIYFLNELHSVQSLNEMIILENILLPNCSRVHESVQFLAVISAFENIQYSIEWIFGDGTSLQTSNKSVSHAYNTPGPFTVQVLIISNSTSQNQSKIVCVQEYLTGLQLVNDGPTLLGQITTFKISFISGSNYEFYWNDDQDTQTFAPAVSFNHTFLEAGTFTMDVFIHNFFNEVQIFSNVSIVERLEVLRVQHDCVNDTAGIFCSLESPSTFAADVLHGTPSSFHWTCDFTILAADTKDFTVTFPNTGIFCLNVSVSDLFSSLSQHFCIEAQVAILDLHIISNSTTMAANEVARLEAVHSSGNNVQYFWRFCETCIEKNMPSVVFHSYDEPGTYKILLEARNGISKEKVDISIYVIKLETFSDMEDNYYAKLDQTYKFHCKTTGVEPDEIEWKFEYGSLSPDIKTGMNISYSFRNTGVYNVQVTVLISGCTVSKKISVKSVEEISNLQLQVDIATSPVIPTHQLINFTTTVDSGTDIEYIWGFTNSDVFFVSSSFYLYSYQKPGKYLITVSASNHEKFHEENTFLHITAIDAVSDVELLIENSTLGFVPQNETITISAYVSKGSNLAYSWMLESSTFTESSFEYVFPQTGNYTIELIVSDLFSSVTASKTIIVVERLRNLQWITSNWTAEVGTEIVLEASLESGSNAKFTWTVANETGDIIHSFIDSSTRKETLFAVSITTPGNYTVTLTVTNNLDTIDLVRVLSLYMEPISGLRITDCCTNPVPVNTTQFYQASVVTGANVVYRWRFAVDSTYETVAYGDTANYSYPVAGSFLVEVEARNAISLGKASESVHAIEKITNAWLVTDADSILVNHSFTVAVTTEGGTGADILYIWKFNGGLDDFNSTLSVQNVTYKEDGLHQITVVCQNEVSSASTSVNVTVIMCKLPELLPLPSTPDEVYRSHSLLLEYNIIEELCTYTPLYTVYNWTVYKTESCSALPSEQLALQLAIETSLPSLSIPSNTLEYGSYCFQLSVNFEGIPSVNIARSLVNVIATPLIALISGGNLRLASSQEDLLLDGSDSIDPDLVDDQKTGLQFRWECTASAYVEETDGRVVADALPVPNPICIQGDLNGDKALAKLYPSNMYVFILTVTKGNRESVTNQTVEVVDGRIPDVQITCLSCQLSLSTTISASQRLELTGSCMNCADHSYTLKWTAIQDDGTIIQLNKISTTTGDSTSNLVVKAGTLRISRSYTFRLTVNSSNFDQPGLAEVWYAVNTPPTGGSCSVTPLESVAMKTLATIACKDWFDPDLPSAPLLYIMQITDLGESNGGVGSTLLYHGSRESYQTYLPLGGNQGAETLKLLVKVQDSQGAEIEALSLSLNVSKPELQDTTTVVEWMTMYGKPQLQSLQGAGDPQRMLDYATSMASVLNEEPRASDEIEACVSLRADIVSSVASCQCVSSEDMSHISTTLAIVTAVPDEIVHEETYTQILSSLDDILSVLTTLGAEGLNTNDVTSNAILMIISNTMTSLNQHASQQVVLNGSLDPKFQMVAINNLLTDTEVLLDSLMSAQLVHEETLRLTSGTITVAAQRTYPGEISTTLNDSETYFTVPHNLFKELPQNVEILEELFIYEQNPYTWHSLAVGAITTKVSQLEYKYSNGTKISIGNLDQNQMIVLGLPQTNFDVLQQLNSSQQVNPGETTYVTMDYDSDVSDLSSYVEVLLTTYSWSGSYGFISLMLGLEEKPNLSTCLNAVNLTFSGSSEVASTKYIFLIKNEFSSPIMAHYLTAINNYNFIANISVSMFQQSCQYYDTQLESWSEYGCQALTGSTKQVATCACNHLTSFGAGSLVVPSDIKFTDLKELDIQSNPVALIVCCIILFLYVIAMGVAWYYDRCDLQFISMVPICGRNGAYCYEIYVKTGERLGAGTTAHIGISIYGSNGKTGSRHLNSKSAFTRNTRAAFRIYSECNLEEVQKVRVWHDNTGLDPSWYLATILVVDVQTDRKFHFLCETWLSLLQDGGAVDKTFEVLGKEQLKKFSTIFQFESKRQLANQHLWLSVIDRPLQSRFTRKQRVTCCLVLIYTYMCMNAMWYGLLRDSFVPSAYKNMPRSAVTVVVEAHCRNSQTSDSLFSGNSFAFRTASEADSGALDLKRSNETNAFEMKEMKASNGDENNGNDVTSSKPLEGATLRPLSEQDRWWSSESILGWPEKLPPYDKSENIELKQLLKDTGERKQETLPGILIQPANSDSEPEKPIKKLCRGKSMRKGIKTLEKSNMLRTNSVDDLTASDDEFWQSLLEEEGVSKKTTQSAKEYSQQQKKGTPPEESGKVNRTDMLVPKSQGMFNPRATASLMRENKTGVLSSDEGICQGTSDSNCTLAGVTIEPQAATSSMPVSRRNAKRQSPTCTSCKRCLLPPWFVYINYIMCFGIVILCGVVVFLYGSQFGQKVTVRWIITLVISLTISMLLLEPAKVLLFALYSASSYESLDSCCSDDDNVIDNPVYEHQELANYAHIIRPPQGFGLLQAKEEGRRLAMMHAMLRHLWVFITLLVVVMIISYLSQNQAGIDTVSVMKDVYVNAVFGDEHRNFNQIQTFQCLIHPSEQCQVEESSEYKNYFDDVCYGRGTSYSEDRGVFVSSNLNWTYKLSQELNGLSVRGQIGKYSGGGFVQNLGSSYSDTVDILHILTDYRWLDRQTRAVFVEATFYNGNLNLYSVFNLLIEFPLSSGAVSSPLIISASLDRYSQATGLLVSEVLFILLLIYFTYIMITDMLHCGILQFLTSFWRLLSVVMVMLGIAIVCLLFVQVVHSNHALNKYTDDPGVFVNFYRAALYSDVLIHCYGLLVFIATVKVLQVLRFSSWLVSFLTVLEKCFWLLMGASVIFFLLILGFSFLGNQLFGPVMSDFRSVGSATFYLYSYITGASSQSLTPLLDRFPVWGAMFMSAFFYFCLVLVTCLFAAVVIKNYRGSQRSEVETLNFQDHNMIDFMIERFKKRLGIIKPKEFRHRVNFAGVDSVSMHSLSSRGTISQGSVSQVSSGGSGISFILPGEKIDPYHFNHLLDCLSPTVDEVLEKLESLKLLEVENEHIGNEFLCRKNLLKGSKTFKKNQSVKKAQNPCSRALTSSLQGMVQKKISGTERHRRKSDPARSTKKFEVDARPKSEEWEKKRSNENEDNAILTSPNKTEHIQCKPVWGRNLSST
ncbi:polycystin-1-like [Anneissia japonica]|uniref:polycystin-1-like n=1 Tax=Anneissia japonica TaxID=1529436 RepID=UPI001425821D|nr:polycystin-1-like [Anneissia japonica]